MVKEMDRAAAAFPEFISFTVTNACNLRCRMCGQWSDEGYMLNRSGDLGRRMMLDDWKRLVEEASKHAVRTIIIRGGEPFLFKGIIELLRHINSKGIFVSIDTNGTLLEQYAADLSTIDRMHITFSVDGPEAIHDAVRKVPGSFQKMRQNIALLNELEKTSGNHISKSVCFTISQYNYQALGKMADVVRSLSLSSINIVPYYYYSAEVGTSYEQELQSHFDCTAFSWKGFHHETSGVEFERFQRELHLYHERLGDIRDYPYLPLSDEEYRVWFHDQTTPVKSPVCTNIERLIDIQPNGEANFCVDFPDYSIGNVKSATIEEVWNSTRAQKFRTYRRAQPLAVCSRCGAKYMSEMRE